MMQWLLHNFLNVCFQSNPIVDYLQVTDLFLVGLGASWILFSIPQHFYTSCGSRCNCRSKGDIRWFKNYGDWTFNGRGYGCFLRTRSYCKIHFFLLLLLLFFWCYFSTLLLLFCSTVWIYLSDVHVYSCCSDSISWHLI